MKRPSSTILASIVALVFWLFDSSIHHYLYHEPKFELIPHDFNELWIRTVVIILIIMLGVVIDIRTKKIVSSERQHEAIQIHKSMASSSQHILNNFLQTMVLLRDEASNSQDFNQELLKYFDASVHEASDMLDRLINVEEITSENIEAVICPDNLKR